MIPVPQTKFFIKTEKGEIVSRGNCYAACIASIMEVPITDVPNVEVLFDLEDGYWFTVIDTFVRSKGWELSNDERYSVFHRDVDNKMNEQQARNYMELENRYYMVSGKSSRGVNHICIYQNGTLIHDPYPTKEGLLTLDNFTTLEKNSQHGK